MHMATQMANRMKISIDTDSQHERVTKAKGHANVYDADADGADVAWRNWRRIYMRAQMRMHTQHKTHQDMQSQQMQSVGNVHMWMRARMQARAQ